MNTVELIDQIVVWSAVWSILGLLGSILRFASEHATNFPLSKTTIVKLVFLYPNYGPVNLYIGLKQLLGR